MKHLLDHFQLRVRLSRHFRRGFTLIELLIVIVIIGILSVGLVPKVIDAPKKARDTVRKADLTEIKKGLLSYSADHAGAYPATDDRAPCVIGSVIKDLSSYFQGGNPPKDPQPNHGNGDCGDAYRYINFSDVKPACYILGVTLESVQGGNSKNDKPDDSWCSKDTIPNDANGDKKYFYIMEKY